MNRHRQRRSSIRDSVPPARITADGDGNRYAFLTQRAFEFVAAHDNAVKESHLIAHVFGAGGEGLWQSLLRQILLADGRFTLRHDGVWTLPRSDPSKADQQSILGDFVAIDVETTGLRPIQHKIIEIGLVKFSAGNEIDRFESFVNPGRKIPAFITKLTGISDEMVEQAPRFADLAERVEQFVGSSPLLGHNVGFDIGFLNGELTSIGRPTLINERIDVMGLAMRLLPNMRRMNLDTVAKAVGLNPRKIHRAGVDAELAAQSALRLADRARDAGYETREELIALSRPPERRPKDQVGRGRAVLDRSLLAEIPKRPGVYIMRDAYDRVIYVGKAKNLRERVGSYYSQPIGLQRKMDGLLESMIRIDVEITGCELEALLLESQLIRRYQPRFNTAMRAHEEYPFIRIDIGNPWPRVTLAKARKDDGSRYFGPFKSRSAARATVDLINSHFPIRTCTRSFRTARSYGTPCLQLDLRRCLGPCVGRANRDQYMEIVRRVVRFLDGEDDLVYLQIWEGLEEAAARLDFEKARRLRNDIRSLRNVVDMHRSIVQAVERHTLLLVLPSAVNENLEVLLMVEGQLWARFSASRTESAESLVERLERSWNRLREHEVSSLDHGTLDETSILNRWISRNWGHPAVLPIPDGERPNWEELANHVLNLSDDAISMTALGPVPATEESDDFAGMSDESENIGEAVSEFLNDATLSTLDPADTHMVQT